MKTFRLMPFVLLLALAHCSKMDCVQGTRETGSKPYAGKPGVMVPHTDDKPSFKAGAGNCTSSPPECQYFPLARIGLHNPTGNQVVADVTCDFFVSDVKESSNQRLGVKVPSQTTIYVEIQQNVVVEAGMSQSLGASCAATFR